MTNTTPSDVKKTTDKNPVNNLTPDPTPAPIPEMEFHISRTLAEKLETGMFDEEDADDDVEERGWIVTPAPDGDSTVRIPVQYHARYLKLHNL